MLKLGSVIKVIKVILRVGDQDKEKIQSLPSVQITDPALCRDPSAAAAWVLEGQEGSSANRDIQGTPHPTCAFATCRGSQTQSGSGMPLRPEIAVEPCTRRVSAQIPMCDSVVAGWSCAGPKKWM